MIFGLMFEQIVLYLKPETTKYIVKPTQHTLSVCLSMYQSGRTRQVYRRRPQVKVVPPLVLVKSKILKRHSSEKLSVTPKMVSPSSTTMSKSDSAFIVLATLVIAGFYQSNVSLIVLLPFLSFSCHGTKMLGMTLQLKPCVC